MFNLFKKKEKPDFNPSLPLTWWIDDISHSVCGLVECPERGLANMPWPDCDKVYLAVDKTAYDALLEENKTLKLQIKRQEDILSNSPKCEAFKTLESKHYYQFRQRGLPEGRCYFIAGKREWVIETPFEKHHIFWDLEYDSCGVQDFCSKLESDLLVADRDGGGI